ncbi:MAG: NADH:ubiquinone reductase (Na(+)-transporting) subunit A, partial [Oceanococcaceae bacterium]
MQITIKKGLDLPITGNPDQRIEDGPDIGRVAVIGGDFIGMKPTMLVAEGDRVKRGQPLFEDKKNPGVIFTAPAGGEIEAINRGARRVLQSVVIRIDGDEAETFTAYDDAAIDAGLDAQAVREQLIQSGLWVALRTRPYSKVPAIDAKPAALLVTAMDSNPGAADPAVVIAEDNDSFHRGLKVLAALVDSKIWICKAAGAAIPAPTLPRLDVAEFSGPHPAGLVGTHIYYLEPVSASRVVWHIGYQDVMMIGRLFATGTIDPRRVIALSGPQVTAPRLLRTRLGACTDELIAGNIDDAVESRVLTGPVLSGRRASGGGRYLS